MQKPLFLFVCFCYLDQQCATCNVLHLSTFTNEPSGEDLCARWLAVIKNVGKGMDLGASNADWVFLSGELYLIVVCCDSHSLTQYCNTFSGDLHL